MNGNLNNRGIIRNLKVTKGCLVHSNIFIRSHKMQTSLIQNSYGIIYKLTNKTNGKCYIGQTTNINKRINNYKRLECKRQPKLYNALKKYGFDNFLFELFDTADEQETLNFLEESYILCFDSIQFGYNDKEGGATGKRSDETKAKISKAHKGKIVSEETRRKISLARTGKKLSKEHKKKISLATSGIKNPMYGKKRIISETTIDKCRRASSGSNNPRFGIKMSNETKQKISKANKGKLSGINNPMYGKHHSDETKQKIRKHHSSISEILQTAP